jgi:hypothetical protein
MRELPEGKRLGVAELTGAVRTTLAPHSGTTKAPEREFKNLFYWAMRMLTELGEVQPGPRSLRVVR